MHLVTAQGTLVAPRERAWPQAGLNQPQSHSGAGSYFKLTDSKGQPNYGTYYMIYKSNPWVFAAVNAISRGLARMPLRTYTLDSDGHRTPVNGMVPQAGSGRTSAAVALDRLLQMPEPRVHQSAWKQKMVIDWLVFGNATAMMDREHAGIPDALWHTSFQKVDVLEGDQIPVLGYKVNGTNGRNRVYLPDEVLHLGMGSDPNCPVGISPIQSLRYTVRLMDALWRHMNAYFENGMRPSGVLTVKPGTSEKALKRIREQIEALYASPEQAGRILVTSAEFSALSNDPQAANLVELAKLSREEVAAAYQVPPPVLGILDRAIQSNVEGLRSQMVRDVLGGWAVLFEGACNAQVAWAIPSLAQSGVCVGFDMDEMLRPDLGALADAFEKLRHVYTPDEMRDMRGKAPLGIPESETVWMPSGQIPLGLPAPATALPKIMPEKDYPDAPAGEQIAPDQQQEQNADRTDAAPTDRAAPVSVEVHLHNDGKRTRTVQRDSLGNIVSITEE